MTLHVKRRQLYRGSQQINWRVLFVCLVSIMWMCVFEIWAATMRISPIIYWVHHFPQVGSSQENVYWFLQCCIKSAFIWFRGSKKEWNSSAVKAKIGFWHHRTILRREHTNGNPPQSLCINARRVYMYTGSKVAALQVARVSWDACKINLAPYNIYAISTSTLNIEFRHATKGDRTPQIVHSRLCLSKSRVLNYFN